MYAWGLAACLAEVRKAGTECRDIVQRILRINQISRSTLQSTDLQALVQDTITFCQQSIDLRHGVDENGAHGQPVYLLHRVSGETGIESEARTVGAAD